MTREELLQRLIVNKAFWSYDTKTSKFNDEIIIEHCLIWGDVEDIKALFEIFDFEKIKQVWTERVIPRDIYEKDNYYLGRIFFEIENIEEYIEINSKKYCRFERIKQLSHQF